MSGGSNWAPDTERGDKLSVKIKVSYQEQEELEKVLFVLSPVMKSYKLAKQQKGKYKNAYVELKEERTTNEPR